jgi:LysM repeat protein
MATAQVAIEQSTEKVRIDGALYYVHVVKKGETLYSLSKAYNVTVEQITQANPELSGGLKVGRNIRIPVTETNATPVDASIFPGAGTPPPDTAKKTTPATRPLYHIVKAGETLWSIAVQYGVTADELRRLNPDAFNNGILMRDALLSIPPAEKSEMGDASEADEMDEMSEMGEAGEMDEPTLPQGVYLLPLADSTNAIRPFTRPLNVALILPLLVPAAPPPTDTAAVDAVAAEALLAKQKNVENYHAFYEGALLAVEELKQQGLSLRLSVYDCYEEQKRMELLLTDELRTNDIIIGPVYAHNLKPVAQYAREHHIKIVSPLDPNAESLTVNNPSFFQVSPPAYCRQKRLIDDILSRENTHLIVVADASGQDSLLLAAYKELLGARWNEAMLYPHYVVKGTALRDSLAVRLRPDKTNCVLVASNQEAIVSDVAANLYLLTLRQRYPIILFGTERWRHFETIDLTYFHTLNLHLVTPFFVDYEKEHVQNFVARFQQTYSIDPSQYAVQGYDTFYYFLQAMMQYGIHFERHLHRHHPPLLQTQYVFRHNGSYANGLVNTGTCLINYTPAYTIEQR